MRSIGERTPANPCSLRNFGQQLAPEVSRTGGMRPPEAPAGRESARGSTYGSRSLWGIVTTARRDLFAAYRRVRQRALRSELAGRLLRMAGAVFDRYVREY